MSFSVKGKLHEIFDEQVVSEKFRKLEFVLEVQDGQYPEHIKFQLVQDKTDLISPYGIGQEVEVSFNLRGRGFNKNGQMLYFTNLEAWKIQPVGGAVAAPAATQNQNPALRAQPSAAPIASDDDNDLPF